MREKRLKPAVILFFSAAAALFLTTNSIAQPLRPPSEEPLAPTQAAPEPGYLGLITDDRQEQGRGVRVVRVVQGSPAEQAGFQEGDVVIAIEGQNVGSLDQMATELKPHTAGDKVRFEIRRGDATQAIEVTLGRRPPPGERPYEFGRIPERLPEPPTAVAPPDNALAAPAPRSTADPRPAARGQLLGIRTAPVTEDLRRQMRLPSTAGARVVSRVVGSPADRANIPLDSVIVAVDGQNVSSPAALAEVIAAAGAGRSVELTYYVGAEQRTSTVTLADMSNAAAPPARGLAEPSVPAPPLAVRRTPTGMAQERIEQLEKRIDELEQRVRELESSLKRGTRAD